MGKMQAYRRLTRRACRKAEAAGAWGIQGLIRRICQRAEAVRAWGIQGLTRRVCQRAEAVRAWGILWLLKKKGASYGKDAAYESRYQPDRDYSAREVYVKAVAFYLPQFHTFPENDRWWGEGFTEWTNTEKCTPRFRGHYQPRRPHPDIGHYDLSMAGAVQKQVELARRHKLYGFCFYYYWFSGTALMRRPLEIFLSHPEWDLHFCLCWANENFTRAWDGEDREVLLRQEYRDGDPEAFIASLKRYMQDSRYIRVGGKPVLLIYNMGSIPDPKGTIRQWREQAMRQGIGEIQIWMCRTGNCTADILRIGEWVDAEVEFPPNSMWWPAIKEGRRITAAGDAKIFSYHKLADIQAAKAAHGTRGRIPLYRTCMMGWDNACRRKSGWTLYYGYSLGAFRRWLRAAVKAAMRQEENIFFINAWNEWGEGTYLEPDERYGYANINALSESICKR